MKEGFLFEGFESEKQKPECQAAMARSAASNKHGLMHPYWYEIYPTEGSCEMPLLQPYNGSLPMTITAFEDRNKKRFPRGQGLHFFSYDRTFECLWSDPLKYDRTISGFPYIFTPDLSLFIDMPKSANLWNIFRNRIMGCKWQSQGKNVIPTATCAGVDSLEYCFDGLPKHSYIAIGHIAIGRHRAHRELFEYSVKKLIDYKEPTKLIVIGFELGFHVPIDVVYYECRINYLRKKYG